MRFSADKFRSRNSALQGGQTRQGFCLSSVRALSPVADIAITPPCCGVSILSSCHAVKVLPTCNAVHHSPYDPLSIQCALRESESRTLSFPCCSRKRFAIKLSSQGGDTPCPVVYKTNRTIHCVTYGVFGGVGQIPPPNPCSY